MYSFCSTSLSAYFSYCSTSLTRLPVQSRVSPSFCCKYKSFKTSSKILLYYKSRKTSSTTTLVTKQSIQCFKFLWQYNTFSKITSVTFLRLLNIAGPLPRLYRNSTKPWNIAFSEDLECFMWSTAWLIFNYRMVQYFLLIWCIGSNRIIIYIKRTMCEPANSFAPADLILGSSNLFCLKNIDFQSSIWKRARLVYIKIISDVKKSF